MKEEYEIKFWKDWLKADPIKRLKLVEGLPIMKEVFTFDKISNKHRKHMFATLLNNFFEDLESAVYTKIRIKKIKNKI